MTDQLMFKKTITLDLNTVARMLLLHGEVSFDEVVQRALDEYLAREEAKLIVPKKKHIILVH